jgi:tripartite-type tricarboxylate transporter receptor subunit TctC
MKWIGTALIGTLCVLATAPAAHADDDYPNRPIRILVPYPPGGSTDTIARPLAEHLRQILKQPVVVENKPGAFGLLAIAELARAKPDGYTLMVGFVNTNAITPVLFASKMQVDYRKAVVPIGRLVEHPAFLIATNENFPPQTVQELVTYAKARPGQVRYGSVGVGSGNHLAAAVFAKQAGIELVHIPNKGGAAMTAELVRGDTHLVASGVVATFAGNVRGGKLRPLAVDSARRLENFLEVPTMAEAGFPPVTSVQWQGMFAPAGTPEPILQKVLKATLEALETDALKQTYGKLVTDINPTRTLPEAQNWLDREMEVWGRIVNDLGVKPE